MTYLLGANLSRVPCLFLLALLHASANPEPPREAFGARQGSAVPLMDDADNAYTVPGNGAAGIVLTAFCSLGSNNKQSIGKAPSGQAIDNALSFAAGLRSSGGFGAAPVMLYSDSKPDAQQKAQLLQLEVTQRTFQSTPVPDRGIAHETPHEERVTYIMEAISRAVNGTDASYTNLIHLAFSEGSKFSAVDRAGQFGQFMRDVISNPKDQLYVLAKVSVNSAYIPVHPQLTLFAGLTPQLRMSGWQPSAIGMTSAWWQYQAVRSRSGQRR